MVPITHKDAFVLWPEPSLSLTHCHTWSHGASSIFSYGFSGEGSCGDLKKKQLARH